MKSPTESEGTFTNSALVVALVIGILLKFACLGILPLTDPSEARFAVAAQQMVLSGDYITPQIYDSVEGWIPYWAKPPFHMWLTALGYHAFGMNTLSARLPSFAAFLLTALLIIIYGRAFFTLQSGLFSALLYISCAGIFLFGTSSLTDPTLSACISSALVCFALAVGKSKKFAGYLFFVALACGFLTKGPISLIIPGATIGVWLLIVGRWRDLKFIPWLLGIPLFLLLTVPWFLIAESHLPDAAPSRFQHMSFNYYFFLTENFGRFLSSKTPILYGTLHHHAYGYIWLALAVVFFPWTFFLLHASWRNYRKNSFLYLRANPWFTFALVWGLMPAAFFTFARQVLETYTFPGIAGLALTLGTVLIAQQQQFKKPALCLAFLAIACGVVGGFFALSHDDYISTAICAAVILGILFILIPRVKDARINGLIAFALLLCLAYGALNAGFAHHIGEVRSTKYAIEALKRDSDLRSGSVATVFKNAPSVFFYLRTEPENRVENDGKYMSAVRYKDGAELLAEKKIRFILVKKDNYPDLSDALREQFSVQFDQGSWNVLKRKKIE